MNQALREYEVLLSRQLGEIMPLFYPRRIVPPAGYPSPKWFGLSLAGQLIGSHLRGVFTNPQANALFAALQLLRYSVPTYFVERDFAVAVLHTKPPSDIPLDTIRFPLPAMLFVLPEEFARTQFGWRIPFLAVTHAPQGKYPRDIAAELPPALNWQAVPEVENGLDRIIFWYPLYTSDMPIDYTGAYDRSRPIEHVESAPWYDGVEDDDDPAGVWTQGLTLPTEEEERAINARVNMFAVSLLMAMTAQPTLCIHGELLRGPSHKKGRLRSALWGPNLIGRGYRLQRDPPLGGTHASPRMHWRRGHFRHQKFGPGLAETRLLWIEPCLVNPPSSL